MGDLGRAAVLEAMSWHHSAPVVPLVDENQQGTLRVLRFDVCSWAFVMADGSALVGRGDFMAVGLEESPAELEERLQRIDLCMRGIRKRFGGTFALKGVDFRLVGGEVHVLLGENGAGKSTLVKILSGVHQPEDGIVTIDGVPQSIPTPAVAHGLGIVTIFQEFSLFRDLTVAENIHLPKLPCGRLHRIDRATLVENAVRILRGIGADLDPLAPVFSLTVAERQMVEIARSMRTRARVVIMDEPTAALSASETARLFNTIRRLRRDGVGVLYISHRLEEVKQIADRITVIRDGQIAGEVEAGDASIAQMVRMMVGRDVVINARRTCTDLSDRRPALSVQAFSRPPYFNDISLVIREGETVGMAGLAGSGSIEFAHALFGDPAASSGKVHLGGKPVNLRSTRGCIRHDIGLISEDRANDGLVLSASVKENVTLVNLAAFLRMGFLRWRQERWQASEIVKALRIVVASLDSEAESLSGGNQQKLVVAKWLYRDLRVLVIVEATRGVDIGARQEIYTLIGKLKARGVGILLVSSDLQELVQCSDRVCVMRRGQIACEIPGSEITRERLLEETLRND